MPTDDPSHPDIRIRPGQPADAATIAEYQVVMARETEDLALDPDTVRRGVEAVFADEAKGRYWIAEGPEGEIVGCMLTQDEWSDWRNGHVWWIHSVYVVPAWRGRGIFRRLYQRVKHEVESTPGLAGLRLYVDKRNASAREVYEAMGMSAEHYDLYEWLWEA